MAMPGAAPRPHENAGIRGHFDAQGGLLTAGRPLGQETSLEHNRSIFRAVFHAGGRRHGGCSGQMAMPGAAPRPMKTPVSAATWHAQGGLPTAGRPLGQETSLEHNRSIFRRAQSADCGTGAFSGQMPCRARRHGRMKTPVSAATWLLKAVSRPPGDRSVRRPRSSTTGTFSGQAPHSPPAALTRSRAVAYQSGSTFSSGP